MSSGVLGCSDSLQVDSSKLLLAIVYAAVHVSDSLSAFGTALERLRDQRGSSI